MTWRILRIATILIIIQSLLFFPAPVSRAQDGPTETEVTQAQEAANLFLKRLEETGDFSYVIDEMYAEDFIERYLQEQIRDGAESNSSSNVMFTSGITYKRGLLTQATIEDWRRLYIATNNFFYRVIVIVLNKTADDLLNDREPDDEMMKSLIPSKVITLFNNHPILKDFLDIELDIEKDGEPKTNEQAEESQGDDVQKQGEPQGDGAEKKSGPKPIETPEKPIETPEEMRSVADTFQEGLRLLLEEHGDHSSKLTGDTKKAIETKIQAELMKPWIRVSDKEYFGFPAGVRLIDVPTPVMFMLTLAEINGKQRIVWAEVFAGD